MTGNVVNPSMREKLEEARRFFSGRAAAKAKSQDAQLYEELRKLAESVEEIASLLHLQKIQLDQVRHGVGLHLEGAAAAPHTRRSP